MTASTVGDDFPIELARVRRLLVQYENLGPNGAFGAEMIRMDIEDAESAWASGDLAWILKAYGNLRRCE